MKLEFIGVNTNKLHDELIAAGITPQLVESLEGTTWITVDENQVDAVHSVVTIHDPAPLPTPKTAAERIAELEAENLMVMMALVELHSTILGGGIGD